jgi:hypothetical protein
MTCDTLFRTIFETIDVLVHKRYKKSFCNDKIKIDFDKNFN